MSRSILPALCLLCALLGAASPLAAKTSTLNPDTPEPKRFVVRVPSS